MPHPERPQIAISLGGSVMMRECEVNTDYLLQLRDFLKTWVEQYNLQAAIVTGGGPVARMRQESLRRGGETDNKVLDRIGVDVTHENAKHLARFLHLGGIPTAYLQTLHSRRPDVSVWVTGGTKVGQTTDAVAVDWARILGYRSVVNITNTPFVYEFGPDGKTPDTTRPIYDMTDTQYLALFGSKHIPGENIPAGRVGIRKAKKFRVNFIVVGPDLTNLEKVFKRVEFRGTIIHP